MPSDGAIIICSPKLAGEAPRSISFCIVTPHLIRSLFVLARKLNPMMLHMLCLCLAFAVSLKLMILYDARRAFFFGEKGNLMKLF